MAVDRCMKLTPELVAGVHRSIPDTGPSPGFVPMEEEDYERLTDEVLKHHPRHDDLWIFAYGSLMWRPGCEIDGQEMALLNGWHRKFCIRIARWRGTQNPGLMMALDRGGSCRAVVQRYRRRRHEIGLVNCCGAKQPLRSTRPIGHAGLQWNQVANGAGPLFFQSYDPVPITAVIFHWRKQQRFSRGRSVIGARAQIILYEHSPAIGEPRCPRPKPVAAPRTGCRADCC